MSSNLETSALKGYFSEVADKVSLSDSVNPSINSWSSLLTIIKLRRKIYQWKKLEEIKGKLERAFA